MSFKTHDWAFEYFEQSKENCKFVLNGDYTFFIYDNNLNNTLVQNKEIIKNLCPNDCSNHGQCSESGNETISFLICI
jgi:hypothetical protein